MAALKSSFIKHLLIRDKFIILGTLSRQAKIFLGISKFIFSLDKQKKPSKELFPLTSTLLFKLRRKTLPPLRVKKTPFFHVTY